MVKRIKKIKEYLGLLLAFFFLSTILTTLVYSFLPVPLTPFMVIKFIENRDVTFKKNWVPISKMSDDLVLSVIASEDQLFLEHFGFDIQAIQKAIEFNQQAKNRRIKGASTISQQTAKNVFLWPGRSWFRKGLEVYFTTLIEVLWSKERIIEVYLNVIEMGKGVYGAQAAAKYYFNKDAKKLNGKEASFLAAILPNPSKNKISPNNPPDYILERQFWILDQIHHLRNDEYDKLFDKEPKFRE